MTIQLLVFAILVFVLWLCGISLPETQQPRLFRGRFGRIGILLLAVVLAVLGLLF